MIAKKDSSIRVLTLGDVIKSFFDDYPHEENPAMFKKHKAALNLLHSVIGNLRLEEFRQTHLMEFLKIVNRLPPHWESKCKNSGKTAQEFAKIEHPVTLSPKTFDDNYVVPVRLFIEYGINMFQDQGFPTTVTTNGVKYRGSRKEGESKQRSFTNIELHKLLNGTEMQKFRSDNATVHQWWLPLIGLSIDGNFQETLSLIV